MRASRRSGSGAERRAGTVSCDNGDRQLGSGSGRSTLSFVVTVTATYRSLRARARWPRDRRDSKVLLTFSRSGAPTGDVGSLNDCFPSLPIHALDPERASSLREIRRSSRDSGPARRSCAGGGQIHNPRWCRCGPGLTAPQRNSVGLIRPRANMTHDLNDGHRAPALR